MKRSLSIMNANFKFSGFIVFCFSIALIFIMIGCDDNDTVAPVNNPPVKPYTPTPADDAELYDFYVDLQWVSTDPENDIITYDLYFDTSNPPVLFDSNLVDYIYPLYRTHQDRLDFGTTYYWKVNATDAYDNIVEGDIWSFSTSSICLTTTYDTQNANKVITDDITSDSSLIYIADDNGGLYVITLIDTMVIRNMVDTLMLKTSALIGSYGVSYYVHDLDIAGDYAYLATFRELEIIDISDPSAPTSPGSYYAGVNVLAVSVEGNYAWVVTGTDMRVIDISDPANPAISATFETPGFAQDIFISGDYAYIADVDSGLQVIDISDTANIVSVGSYIHASGDSAWGVYVSGNTAYVAYGNNGLVLLDITDPTDPTLISSNDTPGFAKDVYVDSIYAFVADFTKGLQVFDISTPSNPTQIISKDTPGGARGVFASGSYIYIADRWNGVVVFEFQP